MRPGSLVPCVLLPLALTGLAALPDRALAQYLNCVEEEAEPQQAERFDPAHGVQPFTDIFDLWLDPLVLAAWDTAGVVEFMNGVIDVQGGGSFLPLWDYFCIGDQDSAWNRILIPDGVGTTDRITLTVMDGAERGHAGIADLTLYIRRDAEPYTLYSPGEAAAGRVFAHELGHVMEAVNLGGPRGGWEAESFATAAEIVSGNPPTESKYQTNHDVSFAASSGAPDGPAAVEYRRFKYWNAYLHGHFSGDPGDPTDDFHYRWVRSTYTGTTPVQRYSTFPALRNFLGTLPEIPGSSGDAKLGDLFHRAALALFVNRTDVFDGKYGFGGAADARGCRVFEHVSGTVLHSRAVPPTYVMGANGLATVTETEFLDPVDVVNRGEPCALKPLGWRTWGTDYLAFTADPAYFNGSVPDTLLQVAFESTGPLPNGARLRVGYITYGSAAEPLFEQPVVEVVESIEAMEVHEGVIRAELAVDGFGGDVKAVVVVASLVQDPVPEVIWSCTDRSVLCWLPNGAGECSQPHVPYAVTYGYAHAELGVPGSQYTEIQDAINAALPGQVVRVSKQEFPYPESLTLRPGIPVLRAIGSPPPVIQAPPAADYAVWFPSNADAGTLLDGFAVVGGEDGVIRLSGAGAVRNCTVLDNGDGPIRGILAENATGEIRDIRVHLSTAETNVYGIHSLNSSVLVRGCEVRTPTAEFPSYGIRTEGGASEIDSCLVAGMDYGIFAGDATVVSHCTVDSTLREGIVAGVSAVVEHAIASNVLTPGYPGIQGTTVRYCIAPQGIDAPPGGQVGNAVEDPLYCDPATRTLRLDSWGNPVVNPSGEPIGAYPVGCIGGTLQRDVTLKERALPVVNDVVVPAGRTLKVEGDGGMRFPPGTGMTVAGTLDVDGNGAGSCVLEGTAGTPGSWNGIAVGGPDARILLANCTLRDAIAGIQDTTGSAADLIHLGPFAEFSNVSRAGVYLRPLMSDGSARFEIDRATINAGPAPFGILVDRSLAASSYHVLLSEALVQGANEGVRLVAHPTVPGPPDTVAYSQSNATAGATGAGFVLEGGDVHVEYTRATGRTIGVDLVGSGNAAIVKADLLPYANCITGIRTGGMRTTTLEDLTFMNCGTAVEALGDIQVRRSFVSMKDNEPALRRGVFAAGTSLVDSVTIELDNGIGIEAAGAGSAIEGCTVRLARGTGVILSGPGARLSNSQVEFSASDATNLGISAHAATGDAPIVEGCWVTVPGGTGIQSDRAVVAGCTVTTAHVGYRFASVGPVNSIATDCLAYGFEKRGGDPGAMATTCLAYCSAGFSQGAQGTESINEDPLFCDAPNGEYTLRVDSYGNPENNPSGERIGAYDVACLYGTLQRDAAFTGGGVLAMPSTLTIPAGRALWLAGDTTVEVAETSPTARITVDGSLYVAGTGGSPVVFRSASDPPGEGDWHGIEVGQNANGQIDYAQVRDATYGVSFSSPGASWVRHSLFQSNQVIDIAAGATAADHSVLLDDNEIVVGGGTGIHLVSCADGVTVRENVITGTSGSGGTTAGIFIGVSPDSTAVTGNTITGCGSGTGVHIATGTPVLTQNTIGGCKYGVLVESGTAQIGTDATDSDNVITGGTNGIRVIGASAMPRIRNNHVHQNDTGVMARTSGRPDLGTGAGDPGRNSLEGNSVNCIRNTTTGVTVLAHGNWYGSCAPPTCVGGNVITLDHLCAQPASARRRPEVVAAPTQAATVLQVRGAWPNPTEGGSEIAFTLDGTGEVEAEVFDVSGRRVRRLERLRFGPGEQRLRWDGRDEHGRSVGTGIYFVRVTGNETLRGTVKVLVAR